MQKMSRYEKLRPGTLRRFMERHTMKDLKQWAENDKMPTRGDVYGNKGEEISRVTISPLYGYAVAETETSFVIAFCKDSPLPEKTKNALKATSLFSFDRHPTKRDLLASIFDYTEEAMGRARRSSWAFGVGYFCSLLMEGEGAGIFPDPGEDLVRHFLSWVSVYGAYEDERDVYPGRFWSEWMKHGSYVKFMKKHFPEFTGNESKLVIWLRKPGVLLRIREILAKHEKGELVYDREYDKARRAKRKEALFSKFLEGVWPVAERSGAERIRDIYEIWKWENGKINFEHFGEPIFQEGEMRVYRLEVFAYDIGWIKVAVTGKDIVIYGRGKEKAAILWSREKKGTVREIDSRASFVGVAMQNDELFLKKVAATGGIFAKRNIEDVEVSAVAEDVVETILALDRETNQERINELIEHPMADLSVSKLLEKFIEWGVGFSKPTERKIAEAVKNRLKEKSPEIFNEPE